MKKNFPSKKIEIFSSDTMNKKSSKDKLEKIIRSNKTINLINNLKKNNKYEIYFLMGADNLINFHKWHKWKAISQKCKIVVFDRQGYKRKSLDSVSFKRLKGKNLEFIKFNKVNISSSQLRKI